MKLRGTAVVAGTAVAAGTVLTHALPAITSIAPLRRAVWPNLAGRGDTGHIALTFDDGPDPAYTPGLLNILDRAGVTATFFLLGSMLAEHPTIGREIAAAGHEIALHGWDHRLLLRRMPASTRDDLARGRDLIEEVTGVRVHWWRPPYGVLTTSSLAAARDLGLTPILWSAWGRDWTGTATGDSVLSTVERGLRPGGTVLLHDSDCTSVPGSSRATMQAAPVLISRLRARGLSVGPLREHGVA
ncbi:MAG TPA: polysaccharide deacetylase family protein [Micromonosporaceae bacterium]|jgi:peptidoglycan/xylan/chitin deacetylase (PgdA/CDA1 family)